MSLAKKAISGTFWMSGISYVGFAVNFAIQLILVRLLVPEDFGLFALGLSIAEILFVFFSFNFFMAVIHIQEAEDLLDTAFYLSLLSALAIMLFGGVLSLILSSYYPVQSVSTFFILCALQPLQGCSSIYLASMEKELQFKKNAIVRGMTMNFAGIVTIFFAYEGFGVWSLVGREIITSILFLYGIRMVSTYRFKRRFNKETAKTLFTFLYKMLFSRGLEMIYQRLPLFLIGTFAGTRELGLFSQTYYLANLPNTLLGPANQNVAYATYSKIQNDTTKISKAYYITNFFTIRFMVPLMLVLIFYSEDIMRILYGNKWMEAAPMLVYFAIYAALLPLFYNAKSYAYGVGRIADISKIYIVMILFLFLGIFIAVYFEETYLVAMAYSVSLFVGVSVLLYFFNRRNVELYVRKLFLKPIFFSLAIVLIWPFLLRAELIPYSQDKVFSLILISIIFVIFTIAILLFDAKSSLENIRYIKNKLILRI